MEVSRTGSRHLVILLRNLPFCPQAHWREFATSQLMPWSTETWQRQEEVLRSAGEASRPNILQNQSKDSSKAKQYTKSCFGFGYLPKQGVKCRKVGRTSTNVAHWARGRARQGDSSKAKLTSWFFRVAGLAFKRLSKPALDNYHGLCEPRRSLLKQKISLER